MPKTCYSAGCTRFAVRSANVKDSAFAGIEYCEPCASLIEARDKIVYHAVYLRFTPRHFWERQLVEADIARATFFADKWRVQAQVKHPLAETRIVDSAPGDNSNYNGFPYKARTLPLAERAQ